MIFLVFVVWRQEICYPSAVDSGDTGSTVRVGVQEKGVGGVCTRPPLPGSSDETPDRQSRTLTQWHFTGTSTKDPIRTVPTLVSETVVLRSPFVLRRDLSRKCREGFVYPVGVPSFFTGHRVLRFCNDNKINYFPESLTFLHGRHTDRCLSY